MFTILLAFHSVIRWIIIITLATTFIVLLLNKHKNRAFTKNNYNWLQLVCLILNIQFIVGILLFSKSQLVVLFWENFQETVKLRQPRFFGLEHPSMMLLGIVLFNYFTFKMRNKINTKQANLYFLKRLILIIIIILSSVPWAFSPLTSRPNFRTFY